MQYFCLPRGTLCCHRVKLQEKVMAPIGHTKAISSCARSCVASFALTGEAIGFLQEEAVGILVAQSVLALGHAAPVGALIDRDGTFCLGAGIRRTLIAVSLLCLVLVVASRTELAFILGRVEK